jgi:hypothetical protein
VGAPPLPDRTRPAQVVLAVGAVLVVAAGAAALADSGNPVTRALLLVFAVLAAGCSAWAATAGLRATRETLAACAVGLAVPGSGALGTTGPSGALAALGLTVAFLVLHALVPATTTWLLAAWGAGQLTVLDLLARVGAGLHAEVYLGVALAGLLLALRAGRLVPRVALVTTTPWEVAGVATGLHQAWTGAFPARELAAVLVAAAAGGLVLARLRPALDPLLGPPRVVPSVAGLLTGGALAGALAGAGTAGVVAAGYVGVLLATTVRELLSGWPRGLFGPMAVAGGTLMAVLSLAELGTGGHWGALALLFLLTALPAGAVAVLRPTERGAAVPTTAACLAGALLLAVPARVLGAPAAAVALTALFAVALAAAAALPAVRRGPTEATAAVCAAASVALAAASASGTTGPAVLLGVQALGTLGWAAWTGWTSGSAARAAWRTGAAELVAACWVPLAGAGVHLLEAWTLPLAAGLLVAAGRGLTTGRSWPAFGPGLLVAAVPSAVAAVVEPGSARPVTVLVAAAGVMVAGAFAGVRAPLLVAAATAVAVALGLAAVALPWPLVTAVVLGVALLAVGARRELLPVAGFGLTLAKLR